MDNLEERPEYYLHFDLKIDESRNVINGWEVYGKFIDDHDEDEGPFELEYPVILGNDGVIDFGYDNDAYSTNLRERKMRLGQLFTVWGDDQKGQAQGGESVYKIVSVAVLGETGA